MQRYEAYRDSGVEWIGEIPAGWEVYPFRRCFSLSKGLAITKANLVDDGLPVISYGQIHAKSNTGVRTHPDLLRFVSPEDEAITKSALTEVGDIVFADTSEDADGCGSCFFIESSGIYAGYHTFVAHPIINGREKFHAYLFQSDEWRSQIRSRVNGVKLFSVTQRILSGNTILLPSEKDAEAITDYLDEKTAQIDSIVSQTERSIGLLREYRKSVISEAVTKGLDPNVPMKDSGVEWIGEIPDTCLIIPLKHLVDTIESGKSIDGAHYPASKDEIGVLTLSAVFQGVFRKSENKAILPKDNDKVSCKLRKGSLLISRCNTSDWVGTAAYVNEDHENLYLPDKLWQLRFKSDHLTRFIQFSLSSKPSRSYFERVSVGASPTMQNISKKDLLDVPIVVFPNDGIAGIVRFLDAKTAEIDSLIADKQRQVELLREYRKSLISEAVTGKFKVPRSE